MIAEAPTEIAQGPLALPLDAQLIDAMRDGLAVFDTAGRLVRWNTAARAITGWTPGRVTQLGSSVFAPGVTQIREGKWVDVRHLDALIDGEPVLAILFTDVTMQVSLRDARRELEDLALADTVTGLPNRKLALGQITRAIALARHDLRPVGVLCVDIDGFGRLNDRLGSSAGDEILRQVGTRVARSIRGSDFAARTGGDEFSVVLTGMGLESDAAIVAVRLLLGLAQPYDIGGEARTVGCSIGIATYPHDGADAETLFRIASAGVREAKLAGGGCYRHGTPGADASS